MFNSPLEQFKVNKIVDLNLYFIDVSLTNGALSLIFFVILLFALNFFLLEKGNFLNKN
jgi:hypothetical protein